MTCESNKYLVVYDHKSEKIISVKQEIYLVTFRACVLILLILFSHAAFSDEKPSIQQIENSKVTGFNVITVQDFKKDWDEKGNEPLKFPPRTGNSLIVSSVMDFSPAADAGLQKLDIIRILNGKLIRDPKEAIEEIRHTSIGNEIDLTIVRSALLGRGGNKKSPWVTQKASVKPVSMVSYLRSCMDTTTDEVNEISIHRHKLTPVSNTIPGGFNLFYISSGGKPGSIYLRISYRGSDWLFIKKYTIKTDKNTYTIRPAKVERDNGIIGDNARVWEWADIKLSPDNFKMIDDIIESENVIVRCEGDQYYKDYSPDKSIRDRMWIVLKNYQIDSQSK